MKILLVEDNPAVRRLIRGMLQARADDVEVYECADGEQACDAYLAHRPHLVLMDLVLPGINGFAATRRIRAVDPTCRIVIVTSHDSPDLREAAHNAGAAGYVLKTNLVELRRWLNDPIVE